jgi:hypothetical protein
MRILALSIIPALMLSGCGMLPKAEPVAYQAPAAVAKPAPVVKKVAVAPKRVVRKPIVQQPASERSDRDGATGPWG